MKGLAGFFDPKNSRVRAVFKKVFQKIRHTHTHTHEKDIFIHTHIYTCVMCVCVCVFYI